MAATTGIAVADIRQCPLCGADVEMPRHESRFAQTGELAFAACVVMTDPGTVHAHVRDEHPERWAELCEQQRRQNENPRFGMPRKLDGTFLGPGEDVGDITVRTAV